MSLCNNESSWLWEMPNILGFNDLDYDASCMKDDIYELMTLNDVLNLPAKNIREHDELDSYDTNFFDI